MAALVDTNVLVYRYDARFPGKQAAAVELLRSGAESGALCLPHQALVELVAVTTRPIAGDRPLLEPHEAQREVEWMLSVFPVLYPDEELLRAALHGAAAYQLSWFDAHLWAYAATNGLPTIYSEDFQHGRWYGEVQVVDPFGGGETVHEPATPYGGDRS
jgi:predicted nucleic acid-binding protein